MHDFKSAGDESFANIEIISSAGRRDMGERRHLSSISRAYASSSEVEGAIDDCESLACSMKESLSSSGQRSGEVEADESELARPPGRRSCRRERVMMWARGGGASAASGRAVANKGVARPAGGVELEGVLAGDSRLAAACDRARSFFVGVLGVLGVLR